jgi:hypothetical protein
LGGSITYASQNKGITPMKWEYMITVFSERNRDHFIPELNKLGEAEWEAVSILAGGHVLMKREKKLD